MKRSNTDQDRLDDGEYCGYCGALLPKNVWYPVVSTTDAPGATRVLSFCDVACKRAWISECGGSPPRDT